MGSNKHARRPNNPDSPPSKDDLQQAADQRRGDAVTVAWMLTAVFALAGEIVAIAGLLAITWNLPIGDGRIIRPVSQLALLIAVIAAVICLALTPLVYRFRDDPPPEVVTYGALLIAAAPLVTALAQWMSS